MGSGIFATVNVQSYYSGFYITVELQSTTHNRQSEYISYLSLSSQRSWETVRGVSRVCDAGLAEHRQMRVPGPDGGGARMQRFSGQA